MSTFEQELKQAFETHDSEKKGHLTQAELPTFARTLVAGLKLSENAAAQLLKMLQAKGPTVTCEEIVLATRRLFIQQTSLELEAPAVQLFDLLKHLKHLPMVPETLKSEIDWSLEIITLGKVYEIELEPSSPSAAFSGAKEVLTPAMAKIVEMLPWLAQYSTPRMSTEDIEAYQRAKKQPGGGQIAPTETKRKSVLLEDLIADIKKHQELIASIHRVDFDIFAFMTTFGRKKVLPLVAYDVLEANGAFSLMDEDMFENFISALRNGYSQENPYHNDVHVADVMQMCHYMLNQGGLKEGAQLDTLDVVSLLLSAIIHDFRHPGVTNGFLQSTHSDLALIYNDQSILENYHISETFKLIYKQLGCNILGKLSPEQAKILRKRVIGCVLATDMARHFEIVTSLQNLISSHDIHQGVNAEKIINKKTALTEFESKQFILSACLHATDIGNPGRVWKVSEEWSNRIMEELWRLGDLEKTMKLPVSYLCDRTSVNVPSSQLGFVSGFTIPIFTKLTNIFPGFAPMLENARKSEQEWKMRQVAATDKKAPEQESK